MVNDLGGSMQGEGADAEPATAVVAEITTAGGVAVANASDVATTEGAQALIAGAVERYGRVDILVNNAGIIRWAGMPEVDTDNLERHLAVHVVGSFNTARAAWPYMTEQGYGRIVMTTSTGMLGLPNNVSYATGEGRGHRARPQPRHCGCPARHLSQPHRPGGHHADVGRRVRRAGAVTRRRRRDGRVPRARGLPGYR